MYKHQGGVAPVQNIYTKLKHQKHSQNHSTHVNHVPESETQI